MIFLFLFSSLVFSQKGMSIADSIIKSVQEKESYEERIGLLQKEIQTIYLTQYEETLALARYGYTLANSRNDSINKGDFLRSIGGAYQKLGFIDSVSIYFFKALKLLEPTKDSEKLGLLYDDMARLYRKLEQPKRALEFYDRALELYEKENDLEGIARINNESGAVYSDNGDYKIANERFEKSLRIQIQRNDSVGIGYSLEFLGYNQLQIRNYQRAESYLMQALKVRKNVGDEFAIMLNYTALGEYYKEINKALTSNEYFEKSNSLARKINFLDIQAYNHRQLMENYEVLGDYKAAYENLNAYNILNDSLYNTQKIRDVEEITAKYETAEKENEILQQRAKIAESELRLKKRSQWIFGLLGLALIVGLLGFLFYRQQVFINERQKRDGELKLAMEKIESHTKLQEQRLSISRDLHDNIGAQLSFVISTIDTLTFHVQGTNDKVLTGLANLGTFTKETMQELRDTVWAMNKSDITIQDLQARMANFVEKAKHAYPGRHIAIQVAATVPSTLGFTALEGLNIFRILQEALNNALKHAGAQAMLVRIEKEENAVLFEISDDGKGFLENEVEPGNGLYNMRKRAKELGGEFHLESRPGQGTRIVFQLEEKKDSK